MDAVYLDTHVVAWLFAGRPDLFPEPARRRLETAALLISPVVELELQYLHEVGKTSEPARTVLDTLSRALGLASCDLPFADVVGVALGFGWTRDPFDRLIAAQAELRGAELVTKDRTLRDHYGRSVWD